MGEYRLHYGFVTSDCDAEDTQYGERFELSEHKYTRIYGYSALAAHIYA